MCGKADRRGRARKGYRDRRRGCGNRRGRPGIVLLLEAASGIEGEIVVDELTEISVESWRSAFLVVLTVLGSVGSIGHGVAQVGEDIVEISFFISTEIGSRQRAEHAAEASLKQQGAFCRS